MVRTGQRRIVYRGKYIFAFKICFRIYHYRSYFIHECIIVSGGNINPWDIVFTKMAIFCCNSHFWLCSFLVDLTSICHPLNFLFSDRRNIGELNRTGRF